MKKTPQKYQSQQLIEYCKTLFTEATEEEFHCIYMTDDLKIIGCEKVCTGRLGTVDIPVRKITRSILTNNCSRLIIAHNHPAGTCTPSRADVDSTKSLRDIYIKLEVELVDHIIVGRDGAMSMRECGYM
jgi:DNA repair protein RadC